MAERKPRQEQVEADLRRWASEMIEACRPGDAEPAQLEIRAKIVRTFVLPVAVQLRDKPAPEPPVAGQLPPPSTVNGRGIGSGNGKVPERSGADPRSTGPQLAPNFANCDPAQLAWCGHCGPLSDPNDWGFDRTTHRPCRRPGCQLGRYRAYRVALERGAAEAAQAERDAGEGPATDPRVRELVEHASKGDLGAAGERAQPAGETR